MKLMNSSKAAAMALSKLEKEYHVHVYEAGPDGKLNLYSLFDYFQDIASEHAIKLGYGRDDLLEQNNFWVLSRIYAEISEMPEWGEKITVTTWPRGIDRLFALRDYEVRNQQGRRVSIATSSWLIIDRITKKIKRPDDTLSSFKAQAEFRNPLPRNAGKLDAAGKDSKITSLFRVRVSDLDVNLHTNNVNYLKWVIDTHSQEFILDNIPVFVEINYLAESRFDDEIIIRMSEKDGEVKLTDYSIFRTTDDTELSRVRLMWNKAVNRKTEKK
mgnify:CR=1 FL=1